MRKPWLGVFTIIFALSIGGIFQPLIERAHAQTINTGENNGGTIGTGVETAPHAAQYGPVDQKAPLDFSTQPASVPHTYVPGKIYNVQALADKSYGGVVDADGPIHHGAGRRLRVLPQHVELRLRYADEENRAYDDRDGRQGSDRLGRPRPQRLPELSRSRVPWAALRATADSRSMRLRTISFRCSISIGRRRPAGRQASSSTRCTRCRSRSA